MATEKTMLKFYEGQINGVDIVILFSGVCKVNAAIATQILIDTFGVNMIINAGRDLSDNSMVIGTSAIIDTELGGAIGMN